MYACNNSKPLGLEEHLRLYILETSRKELRPLLVAARRRQQLASRAAYRPYCLGIAALCDGL